MVNKKANWKAPLLVGGTGLLSGISTYALARALGLGRGWSTALAIPTGVATSIGVGDVADRLIFDRTEGVRKQLEDESRRANSLSRAYSRLAANATHGPSIDEKEWAIVDSYLNDQPKILRRLHRLYEHRNQLHNQGMNADPLNGTE